MQLRDAAAITAILRQHMLEHFAAHGTVESLVVERQARHRRLLHPHVALRAIPPGLVPYRGDELTGAFDGVDTETFLLQVHGQAATTAAGIEHTAAIAHQGTELPQQKALPEHVYGAADLTLSPRGGLDRVRTHGRTVPP